MSGYEAQIRAVDKILEELGYDRRFLRLLVFNKIDRVDTTRSATSSWRDNGMRMAISALNGGPGVDSPACCGSTTCLQAESPAPGLTSIRHACTRHPSTVMVQLDYSLELAWYSCPHWTRPMRWSAVTIPGLKINLGERRSRSIARSPTGSGQPWPRKDGSAPAGSLPPTRDLARLSSESTGTPSSPPTNCSRPRAWFESHTGRGTFLADAATRRAACPGPVAVEGDDDWLTAFSSAVAGPRLERLLSAYRLAIASEGISFASSHPPTSLACRSKPFAECDGRRAGRVMGAVGV